MTPPRILHVIHSSAFGGGPNMLAILCTELHDQFAMEIVCDGQGDMPARVEEVGTIVHRMRLTTKWSFSAHVPNLASLIRKRRPDLVHLHGQFAGALGQLALQIARRPPSIYTAQWPSFLDDTGPWSRFRNRVAERVSCGLATAVVAISDHDRKDFLARRLCDPAKLSLIHNAYAIDLPPTPSSTADEVIGFVGRLSDQKGCEYLVQAAPLVLAQHPDAKFVIVGDGRERSGLEHLARDLRVQNAIDFVGYDSHPAQRMQSMAVVAVPSVYEPLGMVILEAMACARPVVGSAVGGIPEVIEDGRTGLLVPPRDPKALAVALIRLLDNPGEAASMGRAARERAVSAFSPKVIAGQYANLYRRVLKTSS